MPSKKPVADSRRCNCTALRAASRRISQMYDQALAPTGLRATQMTILAEVNRQTDEPHTVSELADALAMDRSTMGQNLRPLERDGLIRLVASATDQRRRNVVLTTTGEQRLQAARLLWDGAQRRFEERLGNSEAASLRRVLSAIVDDDGLMSD